MNPDYPHEIKPCQDMTVAEIEKCVQITEEERTLLELMAPSVRGAWLERTQKERRDARLRTLIGEEA